MIVGALLVVRNRDLAIRFSRVSEHHGHFAASSARQNVAIIGGTAFLTGLALFFLL